MKHLTTIDACKNARQAKSRFLESKSLAFILFFTLFSPLGKAFAASPLPACTTVAVNSVTICAGDVATLTANGATTYIWSTGSLSPVINVSPATTTSYTVTATSGGTGSDIATVTVVQPVVPTTGFTYTTPVCLHSPNQFPDTVPGFTTGGVYSSTGGLIINATTGEINILASTPGTYTVTYSVAAVGCNPFAVNTTTITIVPFTIPVVAFSYASPIYVSSPLQHPITAPGFAYGGIFSYITPPFLSITPDSGIINPALSLPGTYFVSYFIDTLGCQDSLHYYNPTPVTILPDPDVHFSYATPVCVNDPPQAPAGTFDLGGTFSSSGGISLNPVTGIVTPSLSTPGTYTVYYTIAFFIDSATIEIDPLAPPIIAFSYANPVCPNVNSQLPILVAGFETGGTFSTAGPLTVNPLTGALNTTGTPNGTYTINYTVPQLNCFLAGSSSTLVTIATQTPVTAFSYISPICGSATSIVPTLVGGFNTGGTFTASGGLVINPSTGAFNPSANATGTYTINYSFPAGGCFSAGSSSTSVTIIPVVIPVTGFSYSSPLCSNVANPLPVTVPGFTGGGSYSSTAGLSINAATGLINLAASTPGTYIVTYTILSSGCNPLTSSTYSMTITPVITPVTGFSFVSPSCINGGTINPSTVPSFTAGGVFSSSTGISLNSVSGAVNLNASIAGTYVITYFVAASGCNPFGSSTFNLVIDTVIPPTTSFSYLSPVCSNGINPSPITVSGFTAGGVYSSTAGLSINAATGIINLSASTPGTYSVSYSVAQSGCNPAGSSVASITIEQLPNAAFTYATPFCKNAMNPLPAFTGTAIAGIFSSTPLGLTFINTSTGEIDIAGSAAAVYNITNTIAAIGACPSVNSSQAISIVPLPALTMSDVSICAGETATLTALGATSYSWSPGLTPAGINTATVALLSATTTYTVTGTALGCSAIAAASVFVLPLPNISVNSITICNGETATLTASGGSSYSWSLGASSTGTNTADASPSATTTYTVTGSDGFCSSDALSVVTVNPVPTLEVEEHEICLGEAGTLRAIPSIKGGIYLWSGGETTEAISMSPATTTTYSINYSLDGCASNTASGTLTVHALPFINAGDDATVELGVTKVLSAIGGKSYSWSPADGLNCTTCQFVNSSPLETTTYTVTGIDQFGCTSMDEVEVYVDKEHSVYVPNVFSPNGDGVNDQVLVQGSGIDEIQFSVYDRWGEKVFETSSLNIGWDGSFRGAALDKSVFVYNLKVKFRGEEEFVSKKGNISLVR